MATPRLPTIVLAILIIVVGAGLTIYWFRRPVPSDRRQVVEVRCSGAAKSPANSQPREEHPNENRFDR